MAPGIDHDAWVRRVLGVEIADAQARTDANTDDRKHAFAVWQDAVKKSVLDVLKLCAALKGLKDPDADAINDMVVGGLRVLSKTPKTPSDMQEIETFLRGSPEMRLIEADNQFGIKIQLASTLSTPLALYKRTAFAR